MSAGRASRTRLLLTLLLAAVIVERAAARVGELAERAGQPGPPRRGRLPYTVTVYDLPLAPPPPDGQVAGVR